MANLLAGFGYAKRQVPKFEGNFSAWANRIVAFLEKDLGSIARQIAGASHRTVTSDTTVLINDGLILADSTAGPVDVTWPTPISATADWLVTIKRTNAGADPVTIVGTVDGVASPTLAAQYASITIWSDGQSLWKIASI